MLKEAVVVQSNWKLDREDGHYVRFRSVQWDNFEVMRTGTGWLPESEALLLFQFRFYDGVPWLDLGLSPGDDGPVREKLFEVVRQHPEVFKLGDTSLKDSWTILHTEEDYILEDADYGIGWDDGSARAQDNGLGSSLRYEHVPQDERDYRAVPARRWNWRYRRRLEI